MEKCRECGSEPLLYVGWHYLGFTKEKESTYRYYCPKCGMPYTCFAMSEKRAAAAGNKSQRSNEKIYYGEKIEVQNG